MQVSGFFRRVQTAASRPTKPKRKAEKYAEKSMHLINKRKGKEKTKEKVYYKYRKEGRKEERKMHYKYKKICIKRAWPCGRAASGRVAWREALKKYAPKSAGKTCCRAGFQLLPRVKYAQEPKERRKKSRKRGLAGQKPRFSRSAGFRRPECGGGVCGSGGCLVCTLFAGSG